MRTISIEDDVYRSILESAEEIGESATSILRRRLGLTANGGNAANTGAVSSPAPAASGPEQDSELLAFLGSSEFRRSRNTTDKYLAVISYLVRDPKTLDTVLQHSFAPHRKYFAKTKAEIESRGKATAPRRVPRADLYALTNASTHQKKLTLKQMLEVLDYLPTTAGQVADAIEPR